MVPCSKKLQRDECSSSFLSQLRQRWDVIQQTHNTFWLRITTEALLKYVSHEMFEIDGSLFGKESFYMQITVAVAFPLLCCIPSLTQYTQFRQPWSDLTCDIAAAFPPVNFFNCITDLVFADFVAGMFFRWLETYWVVLSLTSSSAPQFVSFVRLTPFELWVKAITQTLWVEAIPSASRCVLIPVFPQCPAPFDHANRNGWHSYSA